MGDESTPNIFQIYVDQKNRIHELEQLIRDLLSSHKDGFHGCCWCGVGVGGMHTAECKARLALQTIHKERYSDDQCNQDEVAPR